MFKIGEFSKLSNISVKMLRHYDEIELLHPDKTDDETNYRYYSAGKLETAFKINLFKNMGFSLKTIKVLLESSADIEEVKLHLKLREAAIKEEQEKLEKQILLINELSERSDKMAEIKYIPLIKMIPRRLVLSLRKTVASYDDEKFIWTELYEFIEQNKITPVYDGYTMAVYHDNEYKESDVDIEIQVTVSTQGISSDFVKFIDVPECNVVSVTFAGSYIQMPKVTEIIAEHFEKNELEFSSKMFNIFHVSPAQTNNEEEYVTEACYIVGRED